VWKQNIQKKNNKEGIGGNESPKLLETQCAGSHLRFKLSAIDVTAKAIHDGLLLVPGPQIFALSSFTTPSASTPLLLTLQLFLDCLIFFKINQFQSWPLKQKRFIWNLW